MDTVSLAIKAEPERIWQALTDGEITPTYYYGFAFEGELTPASPYRYTAGRQEMITGEVVEVEPKRTLTMTFNGAWTDAVGQLPESRVTYRLEEPTMPTPGVSVLTLTHTGMPEGETADDVMAGWVMILSGLKTLLETGEPLAAAPSA